MVRTGRKLEENGKRVLMLHKAIMFGGKYDKIGFIMSFYSWGWCSWRIFFGRAEVRLSHYLSERQNGQALMVGSNSAMDDKAEGQKRSIMVIQNTWYLYIQERVRDTGTFKLVFCQLAGNRMKPSYLGLTDLKIKKVAMDWRKCLPADSFALGCLKPPKTCLSDVSG